MAVLVFLLYLGAYTSSVSSSSSSSSARASAWMRWRRRVRNSSAGMPLWLGVRSGAGLPSRQVGTKGRHKEELAHDKDQRNGTHADEVVQSRFVADHHVAGNGVEQHFQAAAGAVFGQHLDELHADDNVQRPLKEAADLYIVAIKQQARHPLEQGDEAEQQADEHQRTARSPAGWRPE